MNEDRLKKITHQLLGEYQERRLPKIIKRLAEFPNISNKIKVSLGMRRAGKTFFLFQKIQNLIKKKISKERIFYINFEDERLLPLSAQELGFIIDYYYELYPDHINKKCYFFFDEIQNVHDWSQVIRRIQDTKNVELFLTGSSANLLSKEIASRLRGRSVSTEIFPFSLSEYCEYLGKKLPNKVMGPKKSSEYKNCLLYTSDAADES